MRDPEPLQRAAGAPGTSAAPGVHAAPGSTRSRRTLLLVIAVCVAPVIASYLAYYVFPPSDRTNYGALIEPQRAVPPWQASVVQTGRDPDDPAAAGIGQRLEAEGLAAFGGKWVLAAIDSGACALPCAEKLFFMRQTQVSMGRERGRLVRVLLVTDAAPFPSALREAHPDMTVLRVAPAALSPLFPVEGGSALEDHLYLIDPLRNLMMRFPKSPDPAKVRKDLQKLLKASRIG